MKNSTGVVLFFLLLLIYLIPVVAFEYFPTLDGPSHLYNGYLVSQLFSGNEYVGNFFHFNTYLHPNWMNHLIISFTGLFFSPAISEKIIVVIYVTGMAFSFRFFVKSSGIQNNFAPLLIFPFIYTFTFRIGFFNFSFSIALLFLFMATVAKGYKNSASNFVIKITLLLVLLYFSHIMSLVIAVMFAGIYFTGVFYFDKKRAVLFIKKAGLPLLAAVIVTIVYILSNNENSVTSDLSVAEKWTWLRRLAPIVTFNAESEILYSVPLNILFCVLTGSILFAGLKNIKQINNEYLLHYTIGILIILLFALYWIIPNEYSSGGFMSMRLLLLFYLLTALLLSITCEQIPWFKSVTTLILIINLFHLKYHFTETKKLNASVTEIMQAEKFIPEKAVVLPLNYSDNWLHSNIASYALCGKSRINLDNYEAEKPHFPLQWNKTMLPYSTIGNFASSNRPCITIKKYEAKTGYKVSNVLVFGFNASINDSCTNNVFMQLNESYTCTYRSEQGNILLYQLR